MTSLLPLSALLDRQPIECPHVSADNFLFAHSQLACARQLARVATEQMDCSFEEAFDALSFLPENLLSLLTSPQGWSALFQFIAAEMDQPSAVLQPSIH